MKKPLTRERPDPSLRLAPKTRSATEAHEAWLAALRETSAVSDKRDFRAFSDWRGKFVLIISGAAVLLILAYLYFSSKYVESSIVEQFQRHQLTMVNSAASRIQERLQRVKHDLMWLVRMPGLLRRETPRASDLQRLFEEAERFIRTIYRTQGGLVHGVYLVNPQGIVLMRYPPKEERLGATIPEHALLAEALAEPDVVMLELFGTMSGERGLSLIAPIFKDGAPVGAVRAVVDLSTIVKEIVLPLKATENSYAFLMDENGLLLYHPRKEYVGKTWDEVGKGVFFKRFTRGQKGEAQGGSFRYKDSAAGDVELIAFSPVEIGSQRLVLASVSPRQDIAGPIKEYKRRNGAFAGILLLIVAFAAYKYTESRNRRILLEQEREHLMREGELVEEVQAARAYLSTLLDSSPDAIISTDWEGNITFFSPGAEALLGCQREEIIGQRVAVLYENEERAKEVMRRMRQGDGSVAGFETVLRSKDGSLIPVLISASILYDGERQEAGTVGFSKDLRVRKRAEEALIQSEKLAALGRLTAGVSHEILNPLTIIILALHRMIKDLTTHPEIKSGLQEIREQADRITKIVEDLLYFARHRLPERRVVNFNETLKRTLSLLENELTMRSIAVDLRLAEEILAVSADHDQIQQVILNLLTNARDAMPDGGRLVLSTEMVQPDGRKFVELRVEDTGEGIAPEHMEQLFDPFFTTKPEGKGTGLGLSICKGIVEAHEGSIRAENVPEGGAAFIIHLNVERENNAEQNLSS